MKNLITLLFSTSLFLLMPGSAQAQTGFTVLTDFGDNPGELTASYLPANAERDHLVVLLHGCVQNGETLAEQSGLAGLARAKKFALLIPQQGVNNNIKSCFNWYAPQDAQQDAGESLSLKNMILATTTKLNARHVYLMGLSGGGAMAAAMLVNYPQLFSGGAVIAGIPYPCADTLIKAISCMRSGPSQSVAELSMLAKQLNSKPVNWPRLTVWTGAVDEVVNPLNARSLAQQWVSLQQLNQPAIINQQARYKISQWLNDNGETMVELVEINGIGHGMSVNPALEHGGSEALFLLKSPLSAALSIVEFWKI